MLKMDMKRFNIIEGVRLAHKEIDQSKNLTAEEQRRKRKKVEEGEKASYDRVKATYTSEIAQISQDVEKLNERKDRLSRELSQSRLSQGLSQGRSREQAHSPDLRYNPEMTMPDKSLANKRRKVL